VKSLKAAILLILLMAGAARAGEGIRILSADPADNVLLEISTDIPRAVMSSSDLVNWEYVFFHVPPCQNFKAYAPQKERKQTYFKLAPAHSFFQSAVLSTEVPSLAGKKFFTLEWDVSFSGGGVGALNLQSYNTSNRENFSYLIVDSRPGMISARTWIADGRRIDYLILFLDPSSAQHSQFHPMSAVLYAADRFGDFHSSPFVTRGGHPVGGSYYEPSTTLLGISTAVAPEPVNWVDPVGMEVSNPFTYEKFTLGPNGVATILLNGQTKIATYDWVATGNNRATLQVLRSNGTRITIYMNYDGATCPYREPGLKPYTVSGYLPMVTLLR
jgi:hypothetical protein